MVMMLNSPASGRIHYELLPGAVMKPGDLIARLDLDDPDAVTRAQDYKEGFPELGPPLVLSTNVHELFKQALAAAQHIIAGAASLVIIVPVPSLINMQALLSLSQNCAYMRSHCFRERPESSSHPMMQKFHADRQG